MTDLDIYQPPAPGQYQPQMAMTPDDARALDDQLTQCIRAILREGTDYGIIPGTGGDRSLWRPGAQKLLLWFGLGFTCDRTEIDTDDNGHRLGVTYRATITRRLPDGSHVTVATCEGYAGYDETKFYKSADQVQREAEDKERQFAHKDKRPPRPTRWEGLPEYRAPWNTVIKRAQKRAIVGATLDATAAGGRFNQDREEDDHAPPPASDGPTWYEQALEDALSFTTLDAGRTLYAEASEAARDGLCTPRQATHIQNRIGQRARLLKTATPADVEDLAARAAGQPQQPPDDETDETPAAAAPDETPPSDPAPAAGPGDRHRKLVGIVRGHFKRLGYGDADDETRLQHTALLAGTSGIGSTNDLDEDELGAVAGKLATCRDIDALKALLDAAASAKDTP